MQKFRVFRQAPKPQQRGAPIAERPVQVRLDLEDLGVFGEALAVETFIVFQLAVETISPFAEGWVKRPFWDEG